MVHDSRRYHRVRLPAFVRYQASGSYQQSRPQTVSPFGHIPTVAAGKYLGGFAGPFARGIDKGRARDLGQQSGSVLEALIPSFQALGTETGQMARTAYGGYESSVDAFLKQLPGYTGALDTAYQGPTGTAAGDAEAQSYASQAAKEAFSPTASSALYNQFANQALGRARTTEAARGLVDTGASGAAERQDILAPLASQFAAARPAAEQAATTGLTNATTARLANAGTYATGGAGLASMAPTAQAGLFQAMPQLIQSLITSLGLPASAVGSIISMLTGANQPLIQTADVTKPTVAQRSFGISQSAGISDMRLKHSVSTDVPGLEAVLALTPIAFEYETEYEGTGTGLPEGLRYGLSAQAVRELVPGAVTEIEDFLTPSDGQKFLMIDYRALVPILIRAIHDLTTRLALLEAK